VALAIRFKNVLVVMQFVISIVLLVGTTVIINNSFIRSRDIGYDKENLLHLNIHGYEADRIPKWRAAFKSRSETAIVTFANDLPTNLVSGDAHVTCRAKTLTSRSSSRRCGWTTASFPYSTCILSPAEFQLRAARRFKQLHHQRNSSRNNGLHSEQPSAETRNEGVKGQILGVVKDFISSPCESDRANDPAGNTWQHGHHQGEPGKIKETIAAMEEVWNSRESLYPSRSAL